MSSPTGYAPDWTKEQEKAWMKAYDAGDRVLLPHLDHEEGTCNHCDKLRELMNRVDSE